MWWWVAAALAVPNLVVISLDTTRADALSCYGLPPGLRAGPDITPELDSVAAAGVRFEAAWASAPSTLSSHATMFTGLDPHEHGVVRNGFPLPQGIPTLAERLHAAGWDTIAVVGGAPLEGAMGLDRGFVVYDDRLPALQGLSYQDRASGVVDRALLHVERRDPGRALFLFVHAFDPHAPYDPVGPRHWSAPSGGGPLDSADAPMAELVAAIEAGRAEPEDVAAVVGRYAAEVHAVDAQVGRLLASLQARAVLDEAIVVVTADHGEVLAEHPLYAFSHGTDVTAGALRVPLIVRGYGLPVAAGRVVRSQVGLVGLAPTLEALLGLTPQLERPGRRFDALVRAGPVWDSDGWPERPTRSVFLEATRPRSKERTDGWNNLDFHRGVLAGGYAVRAAPVFDEPVVEGDLPPGIASLLAGLLQRWDGTAPDARAEPPLAPATERALRELGYLE
ncbi:MAG: arylsulfatase A-like enzyme [Myxococcota bacterium]